MDFSKLKVSDWLKVGGAAGIFIFGFFKWASFDGFSFSNAFDYSLRGFLPWLISISIAVISVLIRLGVIRWFAQWPIVALTSSGVASLLTLLIFVDLLADSDIDPGIGLWLTLLGSFTCLSGSVLDFIEEGSGLRMTATSNPSNLIGHTQKVREQVNQEFEQHGVAPGWYPIANGTSERYWDGATWTQHVRPLDMPPPPSTGPYSFQVSGQPQAYGVPQAPIHGFATASMVLGICSLVIWYLGIATGIVGLVLGSIALKQVQPNGPKRGRGMAIAGIVCSIVALAIWLIVLMAVAAGGSNSF